VASKRYTFPGNQLPKGWLATRFSQGGQNDGVWTRDIKDNKIYWTATSVGTETLYWGEYLSIPVNATGDIIIEATVRQKRTGGADSLLAIGFNYAPAIAGANRYGTELSFWGWSNNGKCGRNNGVRTPFPGRPATNFVVPLGVDIVSMMRVVRKNGNVFLYIDGTFVGQYAYAPTITTVDIIAQWYVNHFPVEKWLQDLSIYPSSVVL